MTTVVKLNLEDGVVTLDSPYFSGKKELCKAVPGGRWNGQVWTYPLSLKTATSLRETFGENIEASPEFVQWVRTEWAKQSHLRGMGRAQDNPLPEVARLFPKMHKAMDARPYQRAGAAFLSTAKVAGNFDDPGLGKSIQALATIIEAGRWNGKHLIVCPSKVALKSTWEDEIAKWTGGKIFLCTQDAAEKRHQTIQEFLEYDGPKFLGVNHVMLQVKLGKYCRKCKQWSEKKDYSDLPLEHFTASVGHAVSTAVKSAPYMELFDIEWDSIIADECHNYMLTCRSRPDLCKTQWATGLMMLKSAPGGIRQAMSGTPIRGRETNFFGILSWLDPKRFSGFWKWAEEYLEVTPGYGTSRIVGGLRPEKEEAFFKEVDAIFLRRTKLEARPEMAGVQVPPIDKWVEMSKEQAKQYEDWKVNGSANVGEGTINSLGILSEMTRAKQFSFGTWAANNAGSISPTSSPKLDLLLDMFDERGITKENSLSNPAAFDKIIIVSQFTEVIDFIKHELDARGIEALMLTGKDKKYKGQSSAEVFKAPGGPRIMLLNYFTGGTSLTLDEYCDEMVFLDETWRYDDTVQAMGRIDNRGARITQRFFYFLRTKGTVEENIFEYNEAQSSMETKILDERRLLELGRSLL